MAESPRISFRMTNPVLAARLRERAEGAGETNLNNAARAIVEAVLQDTYREELDERLGDLHDQLARTRHDMAEEVSKLRRDISTALEVVLINLTSATKEQAEEFIREKLRG